MQDRTEIHVQVVIHLAEQFPIGGYFYDGDDRIADWIAPTGGENDQLTTCRYFRRHRQQIVTRRVHINKPLFTGPASTVNDLRDRLRAAFMNAAQRFLFQRRDAARFVAGGRLARPQVLMHLLQIVFERGAQIKQFPPHFRRTAAFGQNMLGADDLRGFAEHRRPAAVHQRIADMTHDRIRDQTGRRIGTATFDSEHKFGNVHFLRAAGGCVRNHLLRHLNRLADRLDGPSFVLNHQ